MKTLNKTEQIAKLPGKDKMERRILDMLTAYRSKPHTTKNKKNSYKAMRDRLKLYENGPDKTKIENEDDLIKTRDAQYKDKFNVNRKVKGRNFVYGDYT